MASIDLCLYCTLFGILWVVASEYRYLWSGFASLLILANIFLCAGVGDCTGCLISFWQGVIMIYIILLFIGWFGIPMLMILDYIERIDKSDFDIDAPVPTWWYIVWCGIMITIMILPFYYIYYWIVVNSYRKDIASTRNQFMAETEHRATRIFVINNSSPFLQHLHDHPPPTYEQVPSTFDQTNANNIHGQQPPSYGEIVTIA